jgi:hypothetical protein
MVLAINSDNFIELVGLGNGGAMFALRQKLNV